MEKPSVVEGDRSLRARRPRRHFNESRPPKRLFTPEIKRHLKAWLVRRRNHPYPSREEKLNLALETGLTNIQICNWFANWRRKLKNIGSEVENHTWTALIKTYNGNVEGNLEQFSLSSDDSIWSECTTQQSATSHPVESQCFQISSTSDFDQEKRLHHRHFDTNSNYSKKEDQAQNETDTPLLLKRWLESASCFQHNEASICKKMYESSQFNYKTSQLYEQILSSIHGREELDAAEALTFLSRASRNKQMSSS